MDKTVPAIDKPSLTASHIEDLKQAASKMRFVERRSFESAMALKLWGQCAASGGSVWLESPHS